MLDRWEQVLNGLETDPSTLSRQVDWVAKLQLLEAYRDRHGCGWDDPRMAAVDLQYHDLRPSRSLFARLDTEKLVDEASVAAAVVDPPRTTRAWFRGECLKRWPASVATANWDSLVFDLGIGPPPARPYDGSAEGNGGTCRSTTGQLRESGRAGRPTEQLSTDRRRGPRGVERWQSEN